MARCNLSVSLRTRDTGQVNHISLTSQVTDLPNLIKSRREGKGLTQKALGALVGVTKQSVSAWERGKNQPDPEILPDVARHLDLDPDLLAIQGRPNPIRYLEARSETPPRLDPEQVEMSTSRIVSECYDEAGLVWAVELRFWVRKEPRRLTSSTRSEVEG